MPAIHLRKVRSFVRRPGRVTEAQRRALESLLPRWGLDFGYEHVDLNTVFNRDAPRVLDIGFGNGEALITAAANYPNIDYLGVEVHEPGIGHLLVLLERTGLTNVRIVNRDVVDVIEHMLTDRSFDAVNLFFPDPWPKKRHHKRRLVQERFVAETARILKDGGLLHIATDWADYAEQIRAVLEKSEQFVAESRDNLCNNPHAFRPPTKFERRGRILGHESVDLYYLKRQLTDNTR